MIRRNTTMEKRIAKDLLSIKAVFLRPEEPFTWASGIKSPIYCDNRLTLTAPEVRTHVEEGLAETVRKFGGKQDWYDKKAHRFTVNGELYLMEKIKDE